MHTATIPSPNPPYMGKTAQNRPKPPYIGAYTGYLGHIGLYWCFWWPITYFFREQRFLPIAPGLKG